MHYLDSYRFVFRNPKWVQNLLICAVAAFVPVVGPIVVLGYLFDVIEALHLQSKDRDYPDFDFNRLLHYLIRGAWPFLVRLVVLLPLMLLFFVLYFIFLFGILTAARPAGDQAQVLPWLIFGGCALVFFALVGLFAELILIPMALRAGLMMDFAAGFSRAFLGDFLRRMWLTVLVAELFLAFSGLVVVIAGFLSFVVGVYPAAALVQFAQAHVLYQLYEEYLRRGGQEISLPIETVRRAAYPSDSYRADED